MKHSEREKQKGRMRVNEVEIAWLKQGQKELKNNIQSYQKEIKNWMKSLVFLLLGQFLTFVFGVIFFLIKNGTI